MHACLSPALHITIQHVKWEGIVRKQISELTLPYGKLTTQQTSSSWPPVSWKAEKQRRQASKNIMLLYVEESKN